MLIQSVLPRAIGLSLATLSLLALNPIAAVAKAPTEPTAQTAAQAAAQPKVELQLTADRQVMVKEPNGQTKTTWQPIGGSNTKVGSGDVIRYTLVGQNKGNSAARNLVFNQPIPAGTRYSLQSAKLINSPAEVLFSIDGGKTYSAAPKVKVTQGGRLVEQPAPADAYSHIRFRINQELTPKGTVRAEYLVTVK
jgi:uncharacterized repeat protein (TIGR01451 family)